MLPFDPMQPTPILDPTNPGSPLFPPGLAGLYQPQPDPNAQQGPLAAAMARLQSVPQGPAPPPQPPPGPPPLTANDLLGPQQDTPDIPLPPQYAQSIDDLPPDLRDRANQEALARMAAAIGAAPMGHLGEGLAQANLGRLLSQDSAVQGYQKLQDLQYQRSLVAAEQQAKAQAQTATAQREQQQAQQRAGMYNYVAQTLGSDPTAIAQARAAAVGGDDKALQDLLMKATTVAELQKKGVPVQSLLDLADYQTMHAASLKTAGEADEQRVLGPLKAQNAGLSAGAEEAARLPGQQQLAAYQANLAQSREVAMAKLNDQLMRGRSLYEAMTHLSSAERLAVFDRQLSNAAASQPLTQTEATKALQAQIHERYRAIQDDAKGGELTYKGKQLLPSAALEAIRRDMATTGPQLPPGAAIAPPGAARLPTPIPFPGAPMVDGGADFSTTADSASTLLSRVGTTAGAPTSPAGPPTLASPGRGGAPLAQLPPVTPEEVRTAGGLISTLGQAGARADMARRGLSAAKIDALINEASQ